MVPRDPRGPAGAGPTRADVRSKGHWVWHALRARSANREGSLLREQALRSPCRRDVPNSAVCLWALETPPDMWTQPRWCQLRCESQRKPITRKKWTVMSWVRAPPWKHKFLCKTVQASQKGTDKVGGQGPCLLRGLSCGRRHPVMAVAPLTTEGGLGPSHRSGPSALTASARSRGWPDPRPPAVALAPGCREAGAAWEPFSAVLKLAQLTASTARLGPPRKAAFGAHVIRTSCHCLCFPSPLSRLCLTATFGGKLSHLQARACSGASPTPPGTIRAPDAEFLHNDRTQGHLGGMPVITTGRRGREVPRR